VLLLIGLRLIYLHHALKSIEILSWDKGVIAAQFQCLIAIHNILILSVYYSLSIDAITHKILMTLRLSYWQISRVKSNHICDFNLSLYCVDGSIL